jgi:hypothetical protein
MLFNASAENNSGAAMKNSSLSILIFVILSFLFFPPINAQVSRNDSGREISRTPRPNNGNNPADRDRESEITKGRNNPHLPITPVKKNDDRYPLRPPAEDPPSYIVTPPEIITIHEPVFIYEPVCPQPVIIPDPPDKIMEDRPISEIEENELAILRFNKILEQNPEDTIFYFLRGNAKIITEDYYGAIVDFTTYLKLVPWDKEAYFKRGLAYLYFGDRKNALLDLQIASELGYTKGDSVIKLLN